MYPSQGDVSLSEAKQAETWNSGAQKCAAGRKAFCLCRPSPSFSCVCVPLGNLVATQSPPGSETCLVQGYRCLWCTRNRNKGDNMDSKGHPLKGENFILFETKPHNIAHLHLAIRNRFGSHKRIKWLCFENEHCYSLTWSISFFQPKSASTGQQVRVL